VDDVPPWHASGDHLCNQPHAHAVITAKAVAIEFFRAEPDDTFFFYKLLLVDALHVLVFTMHGVTMAGPDNLRELRVARDSEETIAELVLAQSGLVFSAFGKMPEDSLDNVFIGLGQMRALVLKNVEKLIGV
jgi:hypothetical protein